MSTGSLFVVSAPSGSGKTSLVNALVAKTQNIFLSVSHTTRKQRPGEQNGINYHFVHRDQFQTMIDNRALIEYAEVFGNYYGTSRNTVEQGRERGQDVVLEIDWQGAQQIREMYECICIFILPPGLEVLRDRLQKRKHGGETDIEARLAQARSDAQRYHDFDYLIINQDFAAAVEQLSHIVISKRLETRRQYQQHRALIDSLITES